MSDKKSAVTRTPLCPGAFFTATQDERFKTGQMTVSFLVPLERETAARYALVPYLLRRACAAYPDFTALNRRLSELYGARLHADVGKIGEVQTLSLWVSSLDDRYTLAGDQIAGELCELLCDMTLSPSFGDDGLFRDEDFEQERRQLLEKQEAEKANKRVYARKRCEEVMCADEDFGVSRLGTPEQVEALTPAQVKEAWEHLLAHARVEVFVLTGGDVEACRAIFTRRFACLRRGEIEPCETLVVDSAEDVTEVSETMEISQAKLVMGFRAGTAEPDDEVMSARLMAAVWGGTPHSKLFLNVRERLSLCYYCAVSYDRNKGLFFVESGIEKQNKQAAQEEILRQLKAIQDGDVTDAELENAKLSMSNSFWSLTDSPHGLLAWMMGQCMDREMITVEQAVDKLRAVRREQVVEAANKLTLDTVYLLCDEGGDA